MLIQNYCYTRGLEPDYRDFVTATNLPVSMLSKIRSMIKPIIEEDLSTSRWILFKERDVIVWGICCKNELLSDNCFTDIKGRKVKGFFSIVMSDYKDEELSVPYNTEYFKQLYQREIEPYWECSEGTSHASSPNLNIIDLHETIQANKNTGKIDLNNNEFLCKALGHVNAKEAIATALGFDNMSLVVGCESFDESYKSEENFKNCITIDYREELHAVQRRCPKCKKMVSFFTEQGICSECSSKNNIIVDTKEINEMDQNQYKKLERENRDLGFKINELSKQFKKTDRRLKIMTIICGLLVLILLLLLLSRLNSKSGNGDFSFNNHTDTIYVNSSEQFDFDLLSRQIRIPSNGKEAVSVMWRTNIPKIDFVIDNKDWITFKSKDNNRIILDILENPTQQERSGKIIFQLGDKVDSVLLIQD